MGIRNFEDHVGVGRRDYIGPNFMAMSSFLIDPTGFVMLEVAEWGQHKNAKGSMQPTVQRRPQRRHHHNAVASLRERESEPFE